MSSSSSNLPSARRLPSPNVNWGGGKLPNTTSRLRVLVVIASFGDKNLDFLRGIVGTYLHMDMDVDVMVVSNARKDLGPDVKVVVGLPSSNPWSLPFAHQPIFAQNVDTYDLFIYSEDDMAVTEENIRAFVRLTPNLKPDEIAGFVRYEINQDRGRTLPDAHGVHHWKPDSVSRRGDDIIAEFTNEHAGFYILTQEQLRRAIDSSGFLRAPYEGRYGLPETAATGAYVTCGFRKVVCISCFDNFLIHHLPNRYVGHLGLPLSAFRQQIEILHAIDRGQHPASTLCRVESKLRHGAWSKCYDESLTEEILDSVPGGAKTVLSVGVGSGALESSLTQRGKQVTALPLDSVVGVAASRLGMEVVYGAMEECFAQLKTRRFDCVLVANLLHLQVQVGEVVHRCCELVGGKGTLVLSGPHFQNIRIWLKRALNRDDHRKLRSFQESGIDVKARSKALRQIRQLGLGIVSTRWFGEATPRRFAGLRSMAGPLTAKNWVIQARRVSAIT